MSRGGIGYTKAFFYRSCLNENHARDLAFGLFDLGVRGRSVLAPGNDRRAPRNHGIPQRHLRLLQVPPRAASCHTAVVDGVVIEGHVPAQDIKRLLSSEHDIRLLTVPAMPSGTPGMDSPGAPKQAFKVFSIDRDDQVGVYNQYENY